MELGEKLLQARLEAGLSQRQLCGGEITRNMLSLIEHGAAKPSMKTLTYLAGRLGKSVSYFLEEDSLASPNQPVIRAARAAFDAGDYAAAVAALGDYKPEDEVFHREKALLWSWSHLYLAEAARKAGREPYARSLLEQVTAVPYGAGELERKRLLLLGDLGESVSAKLPSLDEELLLRGEEALEEGDIPRAAALLDAAQEQEAPRWQFLRGKTALAAGDYQTAAAHLTKAEPAYPRQTPPLLEICCRELGDYKRAYEYACKQRK